MYQGWENYQTWVVALWLDNEPSSYHWFQDRTDALHDKDDADRLLADEIQEYVTELNPLAESASMFSDLMGHALGAVDWYEIAHSLLEEYEDE